MVSNIERLAAMYFNIETVDEDAVYEFHEHIGFEAVLYTPKEVLQRDDWEEVVALAMVLQEVGWEQSESFRMAMIAVDGYSEEYDDPDAVSHWLSFIEITY